MILKLQLFIMRIIMYYYVLYQVQITTIARTIFNHCDIVAKYIQTCTCIQRLTVSLYVDHN